MGSAALVSVSGSSFFVLGGEEQILPGESERRPQPERAAGLLPEEPHPGGEGGCTHPTGHPALRYQYLPAAHFNKLETIGNETEKSASFFINKYGTGKLDGANPGILSERKSANWSLTHIQSVSSHCRSRQIETHP